MVILCIDMYYLKMKYGLNMKLHYLILFFSLVLVSFSVRAQRYAVASGAWTGSIWATTPGGVAGSAATPIATDDVFTNGSTVFVISPSTCQNLFVDDVTISGLQVFSTLTITGTLIGHSRNFLGFGFPNLAYPTVTAISGSGSLIFDGTNLNTSGFTTSNELIFTWSSSASLIQTTFSLGANTGIISTIGRYVGFTPTNDQNVSFSGNVSINSGTLQTTGASMTGFQITSGNLVINSGASFDFDVPVTQNGTSSSSISNVTLNGDAKSLDIDSYFNSANFIMGSSGTLTIGFSGTDQTEGWWYQSQRPSGFAIDGSSTIYFSSTNDQEIYATEYGNLIISDGGSGATKQIVGAGSLSVLGDALVDGAAIFTGNDNDINIDGGFLINGNLTSNNTSTRNLTIGGDFTVNGSITVLGSTTNVIMDGTSTQFIQGSGPVDFSDLTISNTSATVSPNNQDIVISGMLDVDPSATFSPNGRQVNLSGNLVIGVGGTITASGTFVFDGSTTVSGSGSAAFNNVTISGSLTAPSQTATIAGNFANSGTFSNVNGTVTFNGNNAQSISGSSTNNFYNLSITNTGATVSNNATTNLNTAMAMAASTTFDADGSGSGVFTIRSTSGTNAARVDVLPSGASITGDVVVQRYFNETQGSFATGVWRNFGTSVSGATVAQITGAGFTITGTDLAREDEELGGPVNDRWENQLSFGSLIANNEGYSMWTRRTQTPRVIGFTGTLNQGTQSMPITYTNSGPASDNGWNLVNNPFPSTVDWDNMNRSGSVSGMVSVWNTDTDTYDTWNGTGSLSNGLIASGQAFWIQTTGAGATLSIPESAKSSSSATFLRTAEEEITNQLIVSLIQEEKKDRTFIHFREDATDGFEHQLDGRKLANGIFNMASLTSSDDILAINSMAPIDNCTKEVKLYIDQELWDDVKKENYRGFIPGAYDLSFQGLNSFTQSFDFVLIDSLDGNSVSTIINENSVYSFSVDTTKVNSWGSNRFTIQLYEKPIDPTVTYDALGTCNTGTEVTFYNTQAGLIYAIETSGELIVEGVANGSDLTLGIPKDKVVVGANIFDVNLKNGTCSNVLLTNELSFESTEVIEITSVENGLNCGTGSVLIKANGATDNAYFNWYESLDAIDPIPNQNSGEYLTPEIDATKFYFVSIVNEVGCESLARTKVVAEVVNAEQPDIFIEGDVISTTAVADFYQWYNDGEIIEGEVTESMIVKNSGVYSVLITTNTCDATSENIVVEILGIKDLEEIGIEIYPNPVIDLLTINSNRLKINSILMYDTKGIEILRLEDSIPTEINMGNIKKGIYIINIAVDNQTITYRLRKK